MKKWIVASLLVIASVPAMAQGHHYRSNTNWFAPALITGIIGYEIARNQQQLVYVQQPVYVQQQPVVIQQPVYVQQQLVVVEHQREPVGLVLVDGIYYKKQLIVINGITQEVLVRY